MGVKLQSALGGSVELTAPSTASTYTLAVPAGNGTVATTDQLAGFRNRIINGAMDIWQRGTTFNSPGNITYTADRWFVGVGGSSPASVARVAGPTGSGFEFALSVTGAAGNSTVQINQRIESVNVYDLAGQPVTIQANIQVSSNQSVGWSLFYANTKDGFGSLTSIATGIWSATTTAQRFTATVAGSSMPAGVSNGLMLLISPNNGSGFTSGTITVTGVQLEKGTVATDFDRRPLPLEVTLCERYYQRTDWWGRGSDHSLEDGSWNARSGAVSHVKRNGWYDSFWNYRTEMRADPSVVVYGSTGINKVRVEIPGVSNKETTLRLEAGSAGRNGYYFRHNELTNGADGEYTSSSGNAMLRANLELIAEL